MQNLRYAEINKNTGAVNFVGEAPFFPQPPPFADIYTVDITNIPSPMPGDIYDPATGRFTSPPPPAPEPPRPRLVITSLAANAPEYKTTDVADDFSQITIPMGASVVASFQVQIAGQAIPIDMPLLRMPITATDGRTAYAIVTIAQGKGVATWTPEQSGRWQITEANINSELPPESQMEFSGIDVFVYN
jgi:hypothetical protein